MRLTPKRIWRALSENKEETVRLQHARCANVNSKQHEQGEHSHAERLRCNVGAIAASPRVGIHDKQTAAAGIKLYLHNC